MSISHQEYQRRYAAIREQMIRRGIDCLLIVGLDDHFFRGNIRYVTGSGRGGCCVFPLSDKPVFLISPMHARSPKLPKLASALDLLDIRATLTIEKQVISELQVFDKGNSIGVVGMDCWSVSLYRAVMEAFKDRIVDAADILASLRVVKSTEEIGKTARAAFVADQVCGRLLEVMQPGMTEFEIYAEVKHVIYRMGCEYSFDLIDGAESGMNMSFFPTDDTLIPGGTLFMEITPAFEGYYAQLPVTLPVGHLSSQMRDMICAWAHADLEVQELLHPGTKVCQLYHRLITSVETAGFSSPYRPGHSIGLDVLDFWSITADNDIELQEGMILAIHPSVLIENGAKGCGMGYTYHITADGAEKFSHIDLASEILGPGWK